jgi:pyrophosphatase PpaX
MGLERLSAEPIRAAYVGDSRFDIIAGRAAGVRTIAALWGPAPRSELEIERPDHIAHDIAGLLEIFH